MRLGAWRGDRPLHTLHHTLVSGAEKSPRFHRGRCFQMLYKCIGKMGIEKSYKNSKCIRRCSKNTPCLEERHPRTIASSHPSIRDHKMLAELPVAMYWKPMIENHIILGQSKGVVFLSCVKHNSNDFCLDTWQHCYFSSESLHP